MQRGGSAMDAAERATNVSERDPRDATVGYGGDPNEDGFLQLDAAVMNGADDNNIGAVAALENIKTPSSIARLVMDRTDHWLLVGRGALRFATMHGFKEEELLTDEARQHWLDCKENSTSGRFPDGLANSSGIVGRYLTDSTLTIGRCAILTEDLNGRPKCHYCGPCSRGCRTGSVLQQRLVEPAGRRSDRPSDAHPERGRQPYRGGRRGEVPERLLRGPDHPAPSRSGRQGCRPVRRHARVDAHHAELDLRPLPDRHRQLERRPGPLPDGPRDRRRRLRRAAGPQGRPGHTRQPAERHLHPPVPESGRSAARLPPRLRLPGQRPSAEVGARHGHPGLRRRVQARGPRDPAVADLARRLRRAPAAL